MKEGRRKIGIKYFNNFPSWSGGVAPIRQLTDGDGEVDKSEQFKHLTITLTKVGQGTP